MPSLLKGGLQWFARFDVWPNKERKSIAFLHRCINTSFLLQCLCCCWFRGAQNVNERKMGVMQRLQSSPRLFAVSHTSSLSCKSNLQSVALVTRRSALKISLQCNDLTSVERCMVPGLCPEYRFVIFFFNRSLCQNCISSLTLSGCALVGKTRVGMPWHDCSPFEVCTCACAIAHVKFTLF